MSFFDNPRNAGLALMIVGLIQIIFGGIISIALGAMNYEGYSTASIVLGVGYIITGAILFMFGSKVRGGTVSAKIDILAGYVKVVGICIIISGIFSAISVVAIGGDLGSAIVSIIISIIIGLIVLFISSKINDGKQTTGDKIIWVILLLAFIIYLILAILEIITIIGIINGICDLIISVFMLMLLFDGEVKKEMGM